MPDVKVKQGKKEEVRKEAKPWGRPLTYRPFAAWGRTEEGQRLRYRTKHRLEFK